MPYKNPEKKKEINKKWRENNRQYRAVYMQFYRQDKRISKVEFDKISNIGSVTDKDV